MNARKLTILSMIAALAMVFAAAAVVQDSGDSAAEGENYNTLTVGDGEYATVSAALEKAGKGDHIQLTADINEDVIIENGKNVVLDLNGHKLTNVSSDTITVALGAGLTITGNGTVDNLTNGKADVFNNGTVVIENGKFTRSAETGVDAKNSGGNSYYNLVNHGKMTISDAEVTSSGHFSSLVENGYIKYASTNSREGYIEGANAANPELTINGGHFTGGINTIKNDDGGVLAITGGTFENVTQNIVLNWNEATISGGEFNTSSDLCAVYSYGDGSELDSGKLTVTGGTFNSTVYIHEVKEGSATISGGTFNGSVVIDETIADAVTVTGGTFADPSVLTHLTDGADVTITLNSDVSCDVVIPAGKVTLDLNGHKLTNVSSDTIAVMLNAVLIIKDSSNGKGTVDNVTDGKAAVYNNGTVTIENGTLTRSADTADSSNYYVILNHGSMVINDVIVKSAGAHASLIDNGYYGYKSTGDGERIAYFEGIGQPNPSLTINRGIFDGGLNTVKNDDGAILEINGGSYRNTVQYVLLNWSKATINGGEFNAVGSGLYAIDCEGDGSELDSGELTITDGAFSGKVYIYEKVAGAASISGGIFSGSVEIEEDADDAVSISGGIFTDLSVLAYLDGKADVAVTLNSDTACDVVIPAGKVTLDLNGYKLTNVSSDTIAVASGAELTIKDSSNGKGTVDNVTNGKADVFNNGTVTILNGTFIRSAEADNTKESGNGNSYYNLVNHGSMTIMDATVYSTGHFSSLIENGYYDYPATDSRSGYVEGTNQAAPSLTIAGGSFSGGINTVKNDDGGVIAINGGTFANITQNVLLNWSKATITGGEFNAGDLGAIYCEDLGSELDSGEIAISGGTFNGTVTIIEADAKATSISGGSFTDLSVLAYLDSKAVVTVTLNSDATCDVVIPVGKVTLDLNGHKLTNVSSDTITVALGAELIITDSSNGEGAVDNVTDGKAAVFNNGTVTIENGKFTRSLETGISPKEKGDNSFYTVLNHGIMTVENGTFENNGKFSSLFENGYSTYSSTDSRTSYIEGTNQAVPSLTIAGGSFSGGINTVKNDDGGELTIVGGTFENVTQFCVMTYSNASITGGTYKISDSASAAIYCEGDKTAPTDLGKLGISGNLGKIILANDADVTLSGDVTTDVIVCGSGAATIDLNGHKLTNASDDTITVALGACLTITGNGTVDNLTNGKADVFNNGTVTILNGTFIRSMETGKDANDSGGNSYYNIVNHGKMTIEDADVYSTGHFSSLIENGYYDYPATDSRSGYVEGTNQAAPSLTIAGGSFSGGINTVKNDDGGVLEIKGGTFENVTQACVLNHNIANITGGIFDAIADDGKVYRAIINCGCDAATDIGKLTISGGDFKGYFLSVSDDNGTIEINGGTFSEYPILYNGNATMTKAADVKLSAPIGYSWNDDGKLIINQYKVTYLVNGEAVGEIENYDYKSEVSVREALEETGYTITPWSTDDIEVTDGKFVIGASDVIFKATKTPNKYSYTINYLDKDKNVLAEAVSGTADFGMTFEAPLAAVVGYTAPEIQSLTITADPESNVVTYVYTINTYGYTVKYVDADGNEIAPDFTGKANYGATVEAPIIAVDGYTAPTVQVILKITENEADNVFSYPYTINSYGYTVKYVDADGKSIKDSTAAEAVFGTAVTPEIPAIDGYTAPAQTQTITIASDVSKNVVTYTYSINSYKVTYLVDGVALEGVVSYDYKSVVAVAEKYAKTGYTVSDWSSDDIAIEDGKFTMPAKDVEIEATTAVNQYSYTVKYVDADGNEIADAATGKADYGATVEAPIITVDGYTAPATQGSVKITEVEADNVYTYTYSINSYGYTVKYVDADGNSIRDAATAEAVFGTEVTPEIPAIDGYTAPAAQTITISFDETKNAVTYVYTINSYGYTVKYVDADGKSIKDSTAAEAVFGTAVTPEIPAIDGYTAPAAQTITIASDVSKNVVTYTYSINSYVLTYLTAGDVVLSELTVEYNSSVTAPADPVREGNYAFAGWFLNGSACTFPFEMPANDVTLVATWDVVIPDADSETDIISVNVDANGAPISSDSMQAIVSSAESDENVTLEVSIGSGITVVFDNAAIRNFGTGAAELTANEISSDELTDAVRNIVGDGTVYSISFGSNTNFGEGTATVTLPYALADGRDAAGLYIAYIYDGQVAETFDCDYSDDGTVTFTTGHFSTYAIMYEEPSDDNDDEFIFALIVAVVIVIAVFGAVFLAQRSGKY